MKKPPAYIILCVGYPSTGKTTCTQQLQFELSGRRNVCLMTTLSIRESLGLMGDLYSEESREKVYAEIIRHAEEALLGGTEVLILDGNFNKRHRREAIYALALKYATHLLVIECRVNSREEIEERLNFRRRHEDRPAHKASTMDLYKLIRDASEPLEEDRLPNGHSPLIMQYNTETREIDCRSIFPEDPSLARLVNEIVQCLGQRSETPVIQQHPKAFIFDIGGVLQSLRWEAVSNNLSLIRPNLTMDEFRNALYFEKEKSFGLYETSQISSEEFWKTMAHRLDLSVSAIGEIRTAFKLLYGPIDEEIVEIIHWLRPFGELFILSNSCPELEEAVGQNRGFYQFFRKIYFSYRIGRKKPDPKSFEMILTENNLQGSECVFIDDVARNVATATALGMKGILFFSPQQLRKELAPLLS